MEAEREEQVGTVARAARVAGAVARVHLEIARREAEQDAGRVLGGVALALAAALFLACAVMVAHAAAVVVLHERRELSWTSAIVAVLAVDVVLAAVTGMVARARFRRPILRDTRDLVAKTVGALTDP